MLGNVGHLNVNHLKTEALHPASCFLTSFQGPIFCRHSELLPVYGHWVESDPEKSAVASCGELSQLFRVILHGIQAPIQNLDKKMQKHISCHFVSKRANGSILDMKTWQFVSALMPMKSLDKKMKKTHFVSFRVKTCQRKHT